MKKQRIVLASVLKPVDDTRMFEKIGKSLSSNSSYQIFIIGYPSKHPPVDPEIKFITHPNFVRLSLRRVLTPLVILEKTFEVRPDVLIVNTHELLIVAVFNRIFFGTKIIYDLQENYYRNILWTNAFPPLIKHLLAIWVRSKETLLSGLFHLFFLAEKGFEKEMKFFRNKSVVLENKSLLPHGFTRTKSSETIRLLFSGTISESTGVFHAIHLATALHQLDYSVRLLIIGYCSLASTLKALHLAIQDKPFITLTGGDQLVPHQEIIDQISKADFGIIYYPLSPHIENKVPTKLFEYLAARLPMLIQNHESWRLLCEQYQAAIPIEFDLPIDVARLLQKMKQTYFYTTTPKDVYWQSEEKKLIDSIEKVLV